MRTALRPLVLSFLTVAAVWSVNPAGQIESQPSVCRRCGWRPAAKPRTIRVGTSDELNRAVSRAQPGTTILIADGEYRLERMLDLQTPDIVLRGASGVADSVVVRGDGMTEQRVGVALSIGAADVTIADMTIGFVAFHGIQVRGERGASRLTVHDVRIVDTGQQLVKGSTDGSSLHADDGLIACSTFEYSDHAPSDYTNGVDVLAGNGWTIRDSTFRRIRGLPEQRYAAGPAILFWSNSQRTLIERNVIVDSSRGIAMGLGPGANPRFARDHQTQYDHQDGRIRNNVVVNLNPWADEGIEANGARETRIEHNTVLTSGLVPWSISVRFPVTTGSVRNNLTTRGITKRDGGSAILAGNVAGALPSWFVNIAAGDLRLARPDVPPVDAGVWIADVTDDMARRQRPAGSAPDAGAFERWHP